MDKLIAVSMDSHAAMPVDVWPEYLEKRYHSLLPRLRDEDDVNREVMWLLNGSAVPADEYDVFDKDGAYRAGRYWGLWDADMRLEEMDREGIAAEIVHHGDFRVSDLFHNVMNAAYSLDAWDAGARAYDRWADDTFGAAKDRLLLVGAVGSCSNMDAALAQLRWISDHGFVGTYAPGFMAYPGAPPLFDPYWEPYWSLCEELRILLVVHAGYGNDQGFIYPEIERPYLENKARGGTDIDLLIALTSGIFTAEFFADLKPRRPMWQLMLGGVLDRHPNLRVAMTEVRADWIPATLHHLDEVYDKNRENLPAKKKPSEYWHENFLAGLSFMHKSEAEMRDEIGVETIAIGRDYPHTEGTWPNTQEWLRAAFAGVSGADLRLMLGENAVRFLDLDRVHLAKVADRIGPTMADIVGPGLEVAPELVSHLDRRCGLLKPSEGAGKLALLDAMLQEDLARIHSTVDA